MKTKPFVFTFLSALCLIEPVMKVLYFKAITHFDFLVILANLKAREGFIDVVDFWLLFPLAGLLILKLRKWTYFGFMAILGYNIYKMATYEEYSWPYNSNAPFLYNYVLVAFSGAVILYFLSPKVREPFFDRRVRWWETLQRHEVEIPCQMRNTDSHFSSQVMNISRTGVFIQYSAFLAKGTMFSLKFRFLGKEFDIPVQVISRHEFGGQDGYGLRFHFESYQQKFQVARLLKGLKKPQRQEVKLKIVA